MILSEKYPYLDFPGFSNEDFLRAIKVLEDCTKPALSQFNFHHPFVAPGGYYGKMWWQLDFSIALFGLSWLNPEMSQKIFMNFETAQKPDGRIPLWGYDTLPDYKNGKRLQRDGVSSFPRIFDAAARIAAGCSDETLLNRILDILLKYLNWWFRDRQDPETKLISAVFEETFIPYFGFAGEYAPVDLNIEILHGCKVTAKLSTRLGRYDISVFLNGKAKELQQAIAEKLWNPAVGLFAAFELKHRTFSPTRMGGSFAALRYQTASPEQRQSMLRILTDPKRFGWGRFALTSVDRTDPEFTLIPDGHNYTGNPCWSGSVWATINENVIRGLYDCGEYRLSAELAEHTVGLFKYRFCEFLNPDTGNACGVMDYAWTAALCMDIIFSRLCGISFDMASRTLIVQPNLPESFYGKEITVKDIPVPEGRQLSLHVTCGRPLVLSVEITYDEGIRTFAGEGILTVSF